MIPGDAFTVTPVITNFLPPLNLPYEHLLTTVLGGVALNNPVDGRMYQQWVGYYEAGEIKVSIKDSGVVSFSLPAADVVTVSLAFDNNMGVVLSWLTVASGVNLYYYDTLTSGYITRNFATATSGRVCVDNAFDFYVGQSDVIFAYTDSGNLYYRQQRDRYDIARLISATTSKVIRVGPTVGNRLQVELKTF